MARPTKLTPETRDKIISMMRVGIYAETAAEAAGIDRVTFYRWRKRGEMDSSGIYRELYLATQHAGSEAEARSLVLIGQAAKRNWKAAAWFLERKNPERWGNRHTVTLQVQRGVEQTLELVREHMPAESYADLIRALAVVSGVAEPTEELNPQTVEH